MGLETYVHMVGTDPCKKQVLKFLISYFLNFSAKREISFGICEKIVGKTGTQSGNLSHIDEHRFLHVLVSLATLEPLRPLV